VSPGPGHRPLGAERGDYPPQPPALPELIQADPFTGRKLSYELREDGALVLALDGAVELLEALVPPRSAKALAPTTLPAP
jgi:hypothetical protein